MSQCFNRMRWKFKTVSMERWKKFCESRKRCREVLSRAISCWRRSALRVGIIAFRRNATINAMHERYHERDEKRTEIKLGLFTYRLAGSTRRRTFKAWKEFFYRERRSERILDASRAKRRHKMLATRLDQWKMFTAQRKYFRSVVGGCFQRYKHRETLYGFRRLKRLAIEYKHTNKLRSLQATHDIEQLEREVVLMRHKHITVNRFARRIRDKLKWKVWMRFVEISKAVKSQKVAMKRAVCRWRRNRLCRALHAFALATAERKRLRAILNSLVSRYKKQGETRGFLKLRRYAKMRNGEDKAAKSKSVRMQRFMRKVLKNRGLRSFSAWKHLWSKAKERKHKVNIALGRLRHRRVSQAIASLKATAKLRTRARQLLRKLVARHKQRELAYGFFEWHKVSQQGSFDAEKARHQCIQMEQFLKRMRHKILARSFNKLSWMCEKRRGVRRIMTKLGKVWHRGGKSDAFEALKKNCEVSLNEPFVRTGVGSFASNHDK